MKNHDCFRKLRNKALNWAPVSEPGFSGFQICDFQIFDVYMALGHLIVFSVTSGTNHGFSYVFCSFLKKLAYRGSQIAYRGSPIATGRSRLPIGRSRLPIGRSRKFIGRSRLWIGRSRCLMHA